MCVGKPALDLTLGPELPLWAQDLAGRCRNNLPAILDVFGGIQEFNERSGTFLVPSSFV